MAYSPHPTAFDAQLFPDMANASSLDYAGFEDVLVDGNAYLNDASPVSHPGTTYAFAGSMAGSDPSLNAMSSAGSFDNPDIWLDQNTWFNPNLKSATPLNVTSNFDSSSLSGSHIDYGYLAGENNGLLGVDPSLINQHPYSHAQPQHTGRTPPYPVGFTPGAQSIPSPTTSHGSSHVWNANPRNGNSPSPYYGPAHTWPVAPMRSNSRRLSIHSATSGLSHGSPRPGSVEVDEDGKERTQCPYPDCGKSFKDLKAHMLTHQNERPEKCPITSCEFHKRGFARKYDRNRHLVTTHCKATIVCGFCPGSGSSAEKSFNRTDMFKAHLVKAHGVDHKPSNSKKKSPRSSARQSPSLPDDVTGKCSTCTEHFETPQELFDHFDECVLRFVTQTDPGEETNEKNLLSVAEDVDVKATMERHSLVNDNGNYSTPDDDDYNSEDIEETIITSRAARSGKGSMPNHKSHVSGASLHSVVDGHVTKNRANSAGKVTAGLTHSKGGVTLAAGKGRKKRKYYPQSWGCPIDQMKLKKRVLCVFDGQRRLCKDDMMLNDDLEVRLQLPNSTDGSYVTDLDVETINRAEAFHGATEEERGPWIPNNYSGDWNLAGQQLTASCR